MPKAHTVSNSLLNSNAVPGDNMYHFACRYVEEAEVDDDAEVTVDEIDDQVRLLKCQLLNKWSACPC